MTSLYLVRHGPTHARAMVGWSDIPADLSDRAALERLNAFLPADAALVSSDLVRTMATADALQAGRTRLPHEQALREIHFGRWEMRAFAEIEAEDPELATAFWSDPGAVRAPGGESWHEMRARSDAAIDRLMAAHPDRPLVVVAHFGVILGQVERALDPAQTDIFAQRIDTLSATVLHRQADGWAVDVVNHLP
ncbi:MAG: histidine phosphatase family protein [Marinibacterium sp.]